MPPPSTVASSCRTYRSGSMSGRLRTPRTRCAWSDCFVCTFTRPAPFGRTGSGEPVSCGSMSPRSAFESLLQAVAELAADAEDHAVRPVPLVGVVEERLARGAADGLLAADDVPAERLVAVEERLVDAADEVARRVEVHVHLLDDHALLALDLVRVEAGVAQHVDEHVERRVARLGRATDVVAGVLLAGEGVELAADRVDLAGDVTRGRAPLGPLEEHVLGEVRDPVRLGCFVARAGRQHHDARHGLRVRHRRGQDPQAVLQLEALEDPHARPWYRGRYGRRPDEEGHRRAARMAVAGADRTGASPRGASRSSAAGRPSTPRRPRATATTRWSSCSTHPRPTCSCSSATRGRRR